VTYNRTLLAVACVLAATVLDAQASSARTPNENGRIPIFEYHMLGAKNSTYMRETEQFRRDLQLLYDRGYRPITVAQLLDKRFEIPAGTSPVVFTFDDSSPGQFRYIERNGQLEVDPTSVVGIWLDFNKRHPDWGNRATFCLLPAAQAGHAFFGDKGIDGQKTEWRFKKVRFLAQQGFELCNHTLWHAKLSRYPDGFVQEQIARGQMAIDSAVPGYKVRTLALPLGLWPRNRSLAWQGSWRDARSGREIRYSYDGILEVAGTAAPSPRSEKFNPRSLPRVQVIGNAIERTLDGLEKSGQRFVVAGGKK
jgi:peptidoglycan/xylan/chitin deacetylase (PgdA/CDA1 family)